MIYDQLFFYANPVNTLVRLFRYVTVRNPPNGRQLEVNVDLFTVVRNGNISVEEKLENIITLLGNKPETDFNAKDENDNCNTALHMAIERNDLEVVHLLLSHGADIAIENGDGKKPLQLAEERNYAEIIDALRSFTSQVESLPPETDRLASHTSQTVPANRSKRSVFHWLLSSTLKADKKLKLSCKKFKQQIMKLYAKKQPSAVEQLTATPPYPTPHVLAQFASMAYRDCKHGDPEPPDGWQLLTTASNCGIWNGYFGAAYWHREHQHVVIAHRGTNVKNLGALVADVSGVIYNNDVLQMSSAITFAEKVVAVLQEIEQNNKIDFELFFTGHSLGGWLAQITAFTAEYLEVKGDTFLRKQKREQHETLASCTVQYRHDTTHSYHPHTVVFDSPGCRDKLSQMANKPDRRLEGHSIDLEQLDITSYLSAPNRINTYNSHLGTVYRILTDLHGIGVIERITLLYNTVIHEIDRIVQALDPKTAQYKDKPNLREVVKWPNGAAERNNFFRLGNLSNNYNPELSEGYPLPCYETKVYDECANCLSVFTQDQREFLVHYDLFRLLSESKKLFSVLKNAEAEKQAEQKLECFSLVKESFRCPDASTLHQLIPYVKRLVRLFPDINVTLLSFNIKEELCKYQTLRYIENIAQSELEFSTGTFGLREFLASDRQILQLQIIGRDAWAGLTEVYWVLQNTSYKENRYSKGQYVILTLEWLLKVNRKMKLTEVLTSMKTTHLLMIACETNQAFNDELRHLFKEMFEILKQTTMKIILTTQSEDSISKSIHKIATETLSEELITTAGPLNWSDLTARSQTEILKQTVIFQNRRVTLNQLTTAESMTDSVPLSDLLKETELTIGKDPVPSGSSGYNEQYYINRTFNHILNGQDILSDLDQLLGQAKHQKVMIIADKAGMGKTTVLTHLSEQIKQNYPAYWLVRIDLNEYKEIFEAQEGENLDIGRVLEFLSNVVLKLKSHLEKELFKKSFEGNENSKVVVMVDGFDKISPNCKKTVLDMLYVLKQSSVEQLWVTTRPHLREELEDNLQQLSYTLQPFSEVEQVEFLKNCWLQTLNLECKGHHRLQNYATALLNDFSESISDNGKEFTGIPLQTRMIAEAFERDFISFYQSKKSKPESLHKLDLLGFIRRFIECKCDIYCRELLPIPADTVGAGEILARDLKRIQGEHQRLALEALFTEDQVQFTQTDRLSDEDFYKIGIVQRNKDGKPQFINRCFAEFYVAEFLINQLTKKTKQYTKVQDFLLNKVLSQTDFQITRSFLNSLLEKSTPSKETLTHYGEKLDELWKLEDMNGTLRGVKTVLLELAAEDNIHIIGFLLKSLKS